MMDSLSLDAFKLQLYVFWEEKSEAYLVPCGDIWGKFKGTGTK